MADAKLARNDARADALRRQFHDAEAQVVGKRPPVDENPAQLVYASLAWRRRRKVKIEIDFSCAGGANACYDIQIYTLLQKTSFLQYFVNLFYI